MAECPTCGAPVSLVPDGDPRYEPEPQPTAEMFREYRDWGIAIGRAAARPVDGEDPEYHEHVAGDRHSHAFNGPHSHGGVSALRRPADGEEGLRAALDLLNSLGIAGPNIRHEEQGMWPDGKASEDDTWDGPGWCVCRRPWPCEALALDTVIRALAAKPSPEAGE